MSALFNVGEVLGSKIALKYHGQAKHSDAREFSCHICGKTFKASHWHSCIPKFIAMGDVSCMEVRGLAFEIIEMKSSFVQKAECR